MAVMHQRTILVVDDEEGILKALQRTLRNENYNIFTALGGEEGLKLLEMRDFDLVMSDQKMPGMDGVTFLQKVKAEQPRTLTIMLTGETEIKVAMQAINEAGVYKFITKPWDDDDLKVTIRRALEALDLTKERDSLRERIKARDALLHNLEKEHPGITRVEKDEDGYLVLE
jgi:two-component system probable response regulator PhcQ